MAHGAASSKHHSFLHLDFHANVMFLLLLKLAQPHKPFILFQFCVYRQGVPNWEAWTFWNLIEEIQERLNEGKVAIYAVAVLKKVQKSI